MQAEQPRVVVDGPLAPAVEQLLIGKVELLPWEVTQTGTDEVVTGIYTYGHPEVDASILDRLPDVKIISNYGVGVDHIDLAAASQRKIAVGHTPGILDGATADMAFALLLSAARRVVEGDRYARGPDFLRYDPCCMLGWEVHGQTLGIVGMGRIGRQVARRARGFDMNVLYCNRRPQPEAEAELGVTYSSLDDLLEQSDFVVLTLPLTDATRHLIDTRALAFMKRSAILINIARGPVVDTAALTEALQNGTIAAAALDVTDPEPLPRNHVLLTLPNVTIVPHLGSATIQTRQRMAELSVENLLAGLEGRPLLHQANSW